MIENFDIFWPIIFLSEASIVVVARLLLFFNVFLFFLSIIHRVKISRSYFSSMKGSANQYFVSCSRENLPRSHSLYRVHDQL